MIDLYKYMCIKVSPDPKSGYSPSGAKAKCREFKKAELGIYGIEVRFHGKLDRRGRIIEGPRVKEIEDFVSYIISNFEEANLHLTPYIFDLMQGKNKGKKLDCDAFVSNFNNIVGHFGTYENVWGLLFDRYVDSLENSRFSSKKTWDRFILQLDEYFLPQDLATRLLIENGCERYNNLPTVAERAKSIGAYQTYDMMHHLMSFLTIDHEEEVPHDNLKNYVWGFKKGEPRFKKGYIKSLSQNIVHAHIGGVAKVVTKSKDGVKLEIWEDHHPLKRRNLTSRVKGELVKRIFQSAPHLSSVTVELRKEFSAPRYIKQTIDFFDKNLKP